MDFPDCLTRPNADCTFQGVRIAQTWNDLALWETFLNRSGVRSVIELGTWTGGMALFFASQSKTRVLTVTTIDSNLSVNECRSQLDDLGCRVLEEDLLGATASDLVRELILSAPGPLVLFCDNGNKPAEWCRYVPMLRPGDFAAVHDWGSEFGPENLSPNPEPFLQVEAEAISSLTRFFRISEC